MKLSASQKFNAAITIIAGQDYKPKEAIMIVEQVASLIPDDSIEVPSEEELDKLFRDIFKKHDITKTTATRLINTIQIECGIKRNQAILYIQTACDTKILHSLDIDKRCFYQYVGKTKNEPMLILNTPVPGKNEDVIP